jgi:hypothetical protein
MQLGETIATYDLGLALRGESGKFEVTSPGGEIYHVTCRTNHSISSLEWAGSGNRSQPFLVRKVTEIVSANQGSGAAGMTIDEKRAGSAGSPFLIENDVDAAEAAGSSRSESVVVLPAADSKDRLDDLQSARFDLSCMESESSLQQPSVWISVKSGKDGAPKVDQLLTASCTNFNQLDLEIRKLHAQLDEIRVRARKKFYSAHAAATA